jgi:ribosomal RNA-processing protein 9
LAVTSVAMPSDESAVYSGSKDNAVLCWDVETGTRRSTLRRPWTHRDGAGKPALAGEVLAVAVSPDGRFVVSGGRDNVVRVYDPRQAAAEVRALTGHRDAVTALCFRGGEGSLALVSGSLDRTLKHWDLAGDMGYVETLFGHQEGVSAVHCLDRLRPLSVSGGDRSARLWSVEEESHAVFRSRLAGPDAAVLVADDEFVTGAQSGALQLWKAAQKKPVAVAEAAHGFDSPQCPRWICSLAAQRGSDLVASGSHCGSVKLWSVGAAERLPSNNGTNRGAEYRLTHALDLPLPGFVNSLVCGRRLLVAGVGREHRMGRWWSLKGDVASNQVVVFRLPHSPSHEAFA